MSPLLRCLCIVIGLFAASAAHAERFDVSVRVFCPASWDEAADRLDASFTSAVDRPCAGIRVVAMDADPLWDEYCGAAYTDSHGIARFRAECGDLAGGRPEVYVKVEGRSVNGFSVGVLDLNFFDRLLDSLIRSITGGAPLPIQEVNELRSHQTFEWLFTPARLVSDGEKLDLGDVAIGGSFSVAVGGVVPVRSEGGAVSQMAARQFWAAQYSMYRLRAGTQYRPMDFNYTVSHPILGTPTTLYDTVVVSRTNNEGDEAADALQATPHEIGHVLYNTYHSGILHWLDDAVPDYMVNHNRCGDDHKLTLAWYEGFAHFVRDYVFQQWDWPTSNWNGVWRPYQGCAFEADAPEDGRGRPGLHIEGNVQALLNNIFFGPVRQDQRIEIGVPRTEEFTCPAGQRRIVSPIGAIECEREVPTTCTAGGHTVDGRGFTDQCVSKVRDPSCQAFEECEPVDQVFATTCSSGRAMRRSGPDACVVTSPAMHALPNGTPGPRPDGTPNMVIGRNTNEGRAWFSLPKLDQVMEWVIAAGTDGHRAREYWDGWIRQSCLPRNGLRYQYCNPTQSPSFLEEIQKLDSNLN